MTDDLRAQLGRWYGSPGRHYHTLDHVDEVLERFETCRHQLRQAMEVYVAVLFHDAVYEVGRPDNEARSAELARSEAHRWFDVDLDRVAELILLTAAHGRHEGADPDAALFLDCDMAILGSESDHYGRYAEGVRREWETLIPPQDYIRGRAAFLRSILKTDRIYLSEFWGSRLEASARANIAAELQRLDAKD